LINTKDGFHIWSEKYDRDMDDIFAIQDEIASAITEKLKVTLLEEEKTIIHKTPTDNKEAYELYLKGRFFWNKRGPGLKKGLECFQEAEKLDPNFALAQAGIADTFALLAFYSVVPPHIAMPKAKKAAERAIELDPARIEGYTSLAFVTFFYEWNWKEAKKRFTDVFKINPNYPPAHYWYSIYIAWVEKKYDEAIKEARKSTALEPLIANNNNNLAVAYINAGRYEEGQKMSEAQIEFDPTSFLGYFYLGVCLGAMEKYAEAIAALQTAVKLSGRHQWPLIGLCWCYYQAGNVKEVDDIYNELIARQKTEYSPGLFASLAAYLTNNLEQSHTFFDLAFEQRDMSLLSFNAWPFWEPLRRDPFFTDKMRTMKLPEDS
jgi:tetratricopeptide (TPR) repeat protein